SDIDAGGAGRVRVETHGTDAETGRRALHEPPVDEGRDEGQHEADVEVSAGNERREYGRAVDRLRLRVTAGILCLEDGRLQQPGNEVERHEVEHDRDDDLVRSCACLQHADDGCPQGATDDATEHGDREVQAEGHVEVGPHEADEEGGDEHLPAATDVEEARLEADREAEASGDEGARPRQGGQERLEASARAEDRTLPHGAEGTGDRLPRRREKVTRAREEVAGGRLHVFVHDDDEEASDEEREHDREHRPHEAAAEDVTPRALPAVVSGRRLLFWGDRRLDVGCQGAHAGIPAIIWPMTSLAVVGSTMPTLLPRYMTMIRSASSTTSSSSVETISTGMPESRARTICSCTNSMEPTSSPRVGCDAMKIRRSRS